MFLLFNVNLCSETIMLSKTLLILLILSLFASTSLAAPDAVPCPLAPRSRLHIGDSAVIAQGVNGLNMRALPARDTGVIALLNAGSTLTVIGGSSCNGGYQWWRVEAITGARGWVAEGTWEGYWVIPIEERERTVDPVEWSCGVGIGSRRCILP